MAIVFKNKRKGISGEYEKEAEKILEDQEKMQKLISKVFMLCDKLSNIPDIGPINIGATLKYVPVACLMIKDYMNGDYREVPLATILTITGAFLYLVSPVNVISNMIPGVGVIDDTLQLIGHFVDDMSVDFGLDCLVSILASFVSRRRKASGAMGLLRGLSCCLLSKVFFVFTI